MNEKERKGKLKEGIERDETNRKQKIMDRKGQRREDERKEKSEVKEREKKKVETE